jgi:hypothetical protein
MGDPEPAPAAQPATAYNDEESSPPPDSLGVGEFDDLRYYGQWHRVDRFGWAWRPTVVSEWQPFTRGHWIWSQYGWMWVDYDPWGWATSHYGYWTWDFAMGWIWIPDYTWSPCQCDWFLYDDYISWAPVPPPGVKFKEPWEGEKAWVSVPVRRFKDPDVGIYRTNPKFKPESASVLSRSAPDVREIERRGLRFPVTEVQLERRVVGEREFAKVKLPPDQQQIIDNQRVRLKTGSDRARFTPAPSPPPSSSGGTNTDVGPPRPQPTESKAKSKDSGAKNDNNNGGKKESKYKDRKDDGKDDSKSGKKKG